MTNEVKLFKTWSSRFGLRVVWALKIKGIPYDFTDEDLSNKSSLLLQYNPVHKKVPVLVHNGNPIAESLVILEYIEETWKDNPLLPKDPYQRAIARFWAKFGDDKVLPSIQKAFIKEGKEQEEEINAAIENLRLLEEELKGGKTYFGGEVIGHLDLALGWLAYLVPVVEEIIGITLTDSTTFPLLFAWMNRFSDAPIIKETLPPREKLMNKYRALRNSLLSPN